MISDRVNDTMTRRPGPYEVRSFCARCSNLDYLARLVVPFSRPVNVCRSCREKLTGVPDTRNMREPLIGQASVAAEAVALPAPAVRGLLMPGPQIEESDAIPPLPVMDVSRTPLLDDAAFAFVFGDGDDDALDPEALALEMAKLEALELEVDAAIAELDRQGR